MPRAVIKEQPSLDAVIDDALAMVWIENADPIAVREWLKTALQAFLR